MTHREIYFLIGVLVGAILTAVVFLTVPARAQTWTTAEPPLAAKPIGCTMVTLNGETGVVTVDWECVEEAAARYPTSKDSNAGLAHVLKAIHDGTARAK